MWDAVKPPFDGLVALDAPPVFRPHVDVVGLATGRSTSAFVHRVQVDHVIWDAVQAHELKNASAGRHSMPVTSPASLSTMSGRTPSTRAPGPLTLTWDRMPTTFVTGS